MPFIDVSDVILDPMIAGTPFIVLRRRSDVNNFGETQDAETVRFEAFGSITPIGENSLIRDAAYATQSNTIQVITEFQLRGAGKDEQGNEFQPDVVLFEGEEYLVITLNQFAKFGAGFVVAECATQSFQTSYGTPE